MPAAARRAGGRALYWLYDQSFSANRHFSDGTCASDPDGGFVLWVALSGGIDTQALYRRAIADDISFAPGALFTNGRGFRNCLRLSAGEPWTKRHDDAIARLAALVAGS